MFSPRNMGRKQDRLYQEYGMKGHLESALNYNNLKHHIRKVNCHALQRITV